MKIGELLDVIKLTLALVGVMTAVLTACTGTGPSIVVHEAAAPHDEAPRRGVIIRSIDLNELAGLRTTPPRRDRVSHMAHRQAESD